MAEGGSSPSGVVALRPKAKAKRKVEKRAEHEAQEMAEQQAMGVCLSTRREVGFGPEEQEHSIMPSTRSPFESTLHSGEICFNWYTCEYCERPSPGIPFVVCNFCGARPSWHHGRCCPWRDWPPRSGCTNPKEDGLAQEAGDQHLDAPSGWGIQPVAPPKPSFSNVQCACCARQKGYEKTGWTQCGHPNCEHKYRESCPDCIMGRMPDPGNPEASRPVCKCCWDPVEEIM